MGDVKIFTELGRYMLGPHGHLVVKAIHEKHTYKEYIGVDACAVTWGFRTREELAAYHPKYMAEKPEDILQMLK